MSIFLLLASPAFAISREVTHNDLPAPVGLQAIVANKSVTLSWQWQPPEELPIFADFGYEIKRQDGRTVMAPGNP